MDESIGGRWTPAEATAHINILELQAAFFALKSFASEVNDTHIQLQMNNTTAVAYLNNMGGSQSSELNALTCEMWEWAMKKSIWLSAVHIPGKHNIDADKESRNFSDRHEWALNKDVFESIVKLYPKLDVDLFATRLNCQLSTYCSWKPEPGSTYVDAFSIDWRNYTFYAFPPFSLIARCVQKITQDKAKGIVIVPLWQTQPRFPVSSTAVVRQSTSPSTNPQATPTSELGSSTSTAQETTFDVVSALRKSFGEFNLSPEATEVVMASWRTGTQKQYKTYNEKYMGFCSKRVSITVNPM